RCRDELLDVVAAQVDQRERHVRLAAERRHRLLAGFTRTARRRARRELAQYRETPLANDAAGALDHRGEDAVHTAVFTSHRTEREREVALFRKTAALEQEELVLRPRRLAGGDDAVQHRRDHVPDLGPHLLARTAERPRMLAAENLCVRVV